MDIDIDHKLKILGLSLPEVAAPAANYVPYVVSQNYLYISGQIPFLNGKKDYIGRLGGAISIEQGQLAAKACALNILAQLRAAIEGDWRHLEKCIKIGGFVMATPEFTDHSVVINGASDLLVDVLGDKGKHTRFAVGASSLPFGVAVEIDAIFELSS